MINWDAEMQLQVGEEKKKEDDEKNSPIMTEEMATLKLLVVFSSN